MKRKRLLIIAPYFSATVPGESWSTYKWISGVSDHFDTTVLSLHGPKWIAENSPIGPAKLINWTDYEYPKRLQRLHHEMMPGYIYFYLRCRNWINTQYASGASFDLIHQINPIALRYPSPADGFKTPYILGPLAGSLPTPLGFQSEATDKTWFRKLRNLDGFRLRFDPILRSSYRNAALVIGVAPYVREALKHIPLHSFETMSETGVDSVNPAPKAPPSKDTPLRLLFVGRVIRTKGVIDAIKAVSKIRGFINCVFDIAGDGDQIEECKSLVKRLNLENLVKFHGRLHRREVFQLYQESHLFLFPSFREPSGNVVIEALSFGCPVITCSNGGPGFVVDSSCGVLIEPISPQTVVTSLAEAIRIIQQSPETYSRLTAGAISRASSIALWPKKISRMVDIYSTILSNPSGSTPHLPA